MQIGKINLGFTGTFETNEKAMISLLTNKKIAKDATFSIDRGKIHVSPAKDVFVAAKLAKDGHSFTYTPCNKDESRLAETTARTPGDFLI